MNRLRVQPSALSKGALLAVVAGSFVVSGTVYAWYFADRIAPRTAVGAVSVGGLTKDQAARRLQDAVEAMDRSGIPLAIGDRTETITTAAIGLDLNLAEALDTAFARGHSGGVIERLGGRIAALWRSERHTAPVHVDTTALASQVAQIADAHDRGRRDIRLQVQGTDVSLLTDTEPGKLVDRDDAVHRVEYAVRNLETAAVILQLREDPPRIDASTAQDAVDAAERMMRGTVTLAYEDERYTISRERIGSWIVSEYDHDQLLAGLDRELITKYIADISKSVNIDAKPPVIETENGKVVSFTPPEVGKAVQEDVLVGQVWDLLMSRAAGKQVGSVLTIPMKATKLELTAIGDGSGITELLGTATTTFIGSPKNRIANIKNGVKHLTGTVIQPGVEFSTLGTLMPIDESNGYLPELVIKGDRTTPELGGGLCQVSTTLFRAAMNAALPITERRNHSFRVGYYEKDANGKFIGPGLDATIYEPNTDLRFLNDTTNPVLIIGYVIGTKITFDFYGTGDGRTSSISGPKTLTETPAGDPVYIETLEIAPGTTKQVEQPHPGGSTFASYTITYADGRTHYQEFTSWYRRWPAVHLVGVTQLSPSPTPFPVSPPLP